MTTSHMPEPAYAYMDIEREFLAGGVEFVDEKARDTLIQLYNVTIGHYLVEVQPKYSWDLWRHDERFRRLVLEEVRVMAAELLEYYGKGPSRAQIFEAGKAVLRRFRARNTLAVPWITFDIGCMMDRKAKVSRSGG